MGESHGQFIPFLPGRGPPGRDPRGGGTPLGERSPPPPPPAAAVQGADGPRGVRPCPWDPTGGSCPRVGPAHGKGPMPTGGDRCPREGTETHGRGLTAASCLSFAPFSTGQGFSPAKCLRPVDFCRGIVVIDRSLTWILPGSTPQVSFHSRSLLP